MKNNKDTTIYPFDKGSGFVVLPENSNIEIHHQNTENIMPTKKRKKVYR